MSRINQCWETINLVIMITNLQGNSPPSFSSSHWKSRFSHFQLMFIIITHQCAVLYQLYGIFLQLSKNGSNILFAFMGSCIWIIKQTLSHPVYRTETCASSVLEQNCSLSQLQYQYGINDLLAPSSLRWRCVRLARWDSSPCLGRQQPHLDPRRYIFWLHSKMIKSCPQALVLYLP